MWIVDIALKKPYTFLVMALAILLSTPFVLSTMATDILPDIDIPVISIIWTYSGLSAKDIETRITSPNERSLTTTINNIEHIESQSLPGYSIIKLYLQKGANTATAIAQAVADEQAQLKLMPQGATPPLIILYSASSTPVIQLGLSGGGATEEELGDAAMNFIRPQIVTVPGAASPFPFGGKTRVVSVDIDPLALLAKGLTATDVIDAVDKQNLILPTGTIKVGQTEFNVGLNGAPQTIAALNAIPVKTVDQATTYLREVAHVRDGDVPQTNIVRQDGKRGSLITVIKNGNASTLAIISALKDMMPRLQQSAPDGAKLTPLFDQSVFVKGSITGLVREALIAAVLTAVLILLFLGDWRSTAIIAVSIPLSIISSLLVLDALGQTINLMTLGGLALAVGILVDDATVTIENIERHRQLGAPLREAVRSGAGEIAVPALVSTLCICIVFVPMFALSGVARYLFVPLAEAVVFAMLASYILSRTLVPTLAIYLLRDENASTPAADKKTQGKWSFATIHRRFDAGFERQRGGYIVLLGYLLARRRKTILGFLAFALLSLFLLPFLGRDFFPTVDAGEIRLHMRAPTGYRIEETARLADQVERVIRHTIPREELQTIVDNLGLPTSGINISYGNSGTFGSLDGDIQIALNPDHHATRNYVSSLRKILPQRFPGVEFLFQPADIITQILNFGAPAAVDVQVTGKNAGQNASIARSLYERVRQVKGAVDVHIQQRLDLPTINVEIDRTKLQQLGMTASDVARPFLLALSGSGQTAPNFWLSPTNGVEYPLTVQTPQYDLSDIDDLMRTPVASSDAGSHAPPQLLSNISHIVPSVQPAVVNHYNIRPTMDIYASVDNRDLGAVSEDIQKLVDTASKKASKGTDITVRGQAQLMRTSYVGLGLGLGVAVALVYMLIVINFQSWVDPLIILCGLPGALSGIVWMLFLTRTPISVPALTGAIMTVGVATANSILVVTFARQRMSEGASAMTAALEAGATRLRPVLMTATAMMIGMIPMALGLGEGAEQNAPLGRAVIGGLLVATTFTLLFVPLLFASVHTRLARRASGETHHE
jgi:multidrug efflux pump subunit AcrB